MDVFLLHTNTLQIFSSVWHENAIFWISDFLVFSNQVEEKNADADEVRQDFLCFMTPAQFTVRIQASRADSKLARM